MSIYKTLGGEQIDITALDTQEITLLQRIITSLDQADKPGTPVTQLLTLFNAKVDSLVSVYLHAHPSEDAALSASAHRIIADIRCRLERATYPDIEEANRLYEAMKENPQQNPYLFTVVRLKDRAEPQHITFYLHGDVPDASFKDLNKGVQQAYEREGHEYIGCFPIFNATQAARMKEWEGRYGKQVRGIFEIAFGIAFCKGMQLARYRNPKSDPLKNNQLHAEIMSQSLQNTRPDQQQLYSQIVADYTQEQIWELLLLSVNAGLAHGMRGKAMGHV